MSRRLFPSARRYFRHHRHSLDLQPHNGQAQTGARWTHLVPLAGFLADLGRSALFLSMQLHLLQMHLCGHACRMRVISTAINAQSQKWAGDREVVALRKHTAKLQAIQDKTRQELHQFQPARLMRCPT